MLSPPGGLFSMSDPVYPDTDPEVAARRRLHLLRHRRRRRLREWRQRVAFWVGAVLVGLADRKSVV